MAGLRERIRHAPATPRQSSTLILRAAAAYFALVFGAGFLLGRDVLDRDPVSGSVFGLSLLLYAALPWLHARALTGRTRP